MVRFKFLYVPIWVLVCLVFPPHASAETISGTVKDPSGGIVIGARIEISGANLLQPLGFTTDESGKFVAPNLEAGKYSVRVGKEGFDDVLTEVDLHGTADPAFSLKIASPETRISVRETSAAFPNSESPYR